ncbi:MULTISPECIES: hypothetical protein [Nocardia]|uniref:Uncharacterized protein n=1 Tax=Nocardia nova TaxID=37330 RepID=A0A2T2YRB6_9NOCA|nr:MULTISPECIES: hypothetical protein [Nocardia]PSR58060.1 hypothetical protein C8259_32140 [Nocardia nova]
MTNTGLVDEMVDRLISSNWSDPELAVAHTNSRQRLVAEYLYRVALWVDICELDLIRGEWPFVDLANHLHCEVQTPPAAWEELSSARANISPWDKQLISAALRWAAVADAGYQPVVELPDPFEPLIVFFGRGGGLIWENGMFDIGGSMIVLRDPKYWIDRGGILKELGQEYLDRLDDV